MNHDESDPSTVPFLLADADDFSLGEWLRRLDGIRRLA